MPYKDPEKAAQAKRNYYERNKELCKARAAAHKLKDPEKEKRRLRQWHIDHPDAVKLQSVRWKRENPDKVKAEKLNYRLRNPGKWAAYCATRRALKLRATPSWADLSKIALVYELAASLSQCGVAFEVDHIVPMNSPLVCGLHVESNLQILTEAANMSKGNRFWPDMP